MDKAIEAAARAIDPSAWVDDLYFHTAHQRIRRENALHSAKVAIEAYLAASGLAEERVVIDNRHPDCHKAADAFWEYWNENGETHKRGYYESTWGAINAALRLVGVRKAAGG